MPTLATYRYKNGRQLVLGKRLGRGGEGDVFELNDDPSKVAKVYHTIPDPITSEKILRMVSACTPSLLSIAAWPSEVFFSDEKMAGFIMPRVDKDYREIVELYSPAYRKSKFPKVDYSFLVHSGINLCAAFDTVHGAGHVIGDVNQKNILVNSQAMVKLVDCDSFQITYGQETYKCPVGVDEYTAPELHGEDFRTTLRTTSHDSFGLAILLFQLLFMGRHPFFGVYIGPGQPPSPEEAIKQHRFAYGAQAQQLFEMKPPPGSVPFDTMPTAVCGLFEQAFSQQQLDQRRPLASEWLSQLKHLKESLIKCSQSKTHRYPGQLKDCAWCKLEADNIIFFLGELNSQILKSGLVLNEALTEEIAALIKEANTLFNCTVGKPSPSAQAAPDYLRHSKSLGHSVGLSCIAALVLSWFGWLGSSAPVVDGTLILWWLYLGKRSSYVLHLSAAKSEFDTVRDKFAALESRVKNLQSKLGSDGKQIILDSERLSKKYLSLAAESERAVSDLESDRLRVQQKEFLQKFQIEKCKADKIGPQRKSTLRSFGIETAWDIERDRIERIPGFGRAYADALLAWREKLLKKFRFDPMKCVSPQERMQVIQRYHQQALNVEAQLKNLETKLKWLTKQLRDEIDPCLQQISSLEPQFASVQGQWLAIEKI